MHSPLPVHVLIVSLLVVLAAVHLAATFHRASGRSIRPLRLLPTPGGAVRLQMKLTSGHSPVLALPFRIHGYESVFILDTGYAGAPVLNARLLHLPGNQCVDEALRHISEVDTSRQASYRQLLRFAEKNHCIDYTSGCLQRLMGIGASSESSSDMLMCPGIELVRHGGGGGYTCPKAVTPLPLADVVMTNHEMASPHILTLDYLMHLSPCLISMSREVLQVAMSAVEFGVHRARSTSMATQLSGGAFVCTVEVDGHPFRCTVDTGAGTTVCIGRSGSERLRARSQPNHHLQQVGIHSEQICSDVVRSGTVRVAGSQFRNLPVFLNSMETDVTDGYVGLGLLRAFDMLVTPTELFARRNGRDAYGMREYSAVLRPGPCAEPQ